MKTANTIADVILRYLQGNGLTIVRLADTTFGSDGADAAFAVDIAVHAEKALAEVHVVTWSPSHHTNEGPQ